MWGCLEMLHLAGVPPLFLPLRHRTRNSEPLTHAVHNPDLNLESVCCSCLLDFLHAGWTFCILAGDSVHAGWTLCMLAGLCAFWQRFLHAGWTNCTLAGLRACWLDFSHADWTCLHAGWTFCTFCLLAALCACSLDFLHAPGSRDQFQVSLYLCG